MLQRCGSQYTCTLRELGECSQRESTLALLMRKRNRTQQRLAWNLLKPRTRVTVSGAETSSRTASSDRPEKGAELSSHSEQTLPHLLLSVWTRQHGAAPLQRGTVTCKESQHLLGLAVCEGQSRRTLDEAAQPQPMQTEPFRPLVEKQAPEPLKQCEEASEESPTLRKAASAAAFADNFSD